MLFLEVKNPMSQSWFSYNYWKKDMQFFMTYKISNPIVNDKCPGPNNTK